MVTGGECIHSEQGQIEQDQNALARMDHLEGLPQEICRRIDSKTAEPFVEYCWSDHTWLVDQLFYTQRAEIVCWHILQWGSFFCHVDPVIRYATSTV